MISVLLASPVAFSPQLSLAAREQHMVSPCLRASLLTLQQREPPKSFAQQQADKAAAEAALEAANAKLEELNKVEKLAPKSWADLGVPPEPEPENPLSGALSIAPLVLGALSVGLFLLNNLGTFGEGPDLDALVEEWSRTDNYGSAASSVKETVEAVTETINAVSEAAE